MSLYWRILLLVRTRTLHSVDNNSLRKDTGTWVRQVTHACWTMPRIPGDRLCSVFCEQIGERRIGTQTRRQGRSEKRRGIAASATVEKKEEEKKRRRRKTRRRSSSKEAESIVTFFLCLSPCKEPPRFFPVPFLFPSPPNFIPVHHAVPCTSPKPSQTHRLVLRCAPLLAALHIAYHSLAFCPPYYVLGHYEQREERERRKAEEEKERAENTYMHAWIHVSDSREIKWHFVVFRHNVSHVMLVQSRINAKIIAFQCGNCLFYSISS